MTTRKFKINTLSMALIVIGLLTILPACNSVIELGIEPTSTPLPTAIPVTTSPTAISQSPTEIVQMPPATETPLPTAAPVEAEPTPAPSPEPQIWETVDDTTNRYTNDPYGFSLTFPNTWQISEDSHSIMLVKDSVNLYIGFKWLLESVDVWSRSGTAAGDWETRGQVTVMGEAVDRVALVYNNKIMAVFYGGAPSLIQSGDIMFSIVADSLDPNIDVEKLDALLAETDPIVESITMVQTPSLKPGEYPVVGWYGSVHSDATYGDYIELQPEGAGVYGVAGADEIVEGQIAALRDKEPPNKYANFWGKLVCDVADYGGCTLIASKLRPDGPGPMFDQDEVVGWVGTIYANPEMAQIDDSFTLAGSYPIQYGIWSENTDIAAQIVELRNTGIHVRVWGQVFCGVIDANGCQIQVSQLDKLE